jgi:small nuclear ribonucleoprotein (snRNP)-like protein
MAPKAKKTRFSSSLLALLVALTGKKLIVELRNDVVVTAKLADVDEHMK